MTDAIPSRAAMPRLRKRTYKTLESRRRALERYDTRVESTGCGTGGYYLWVYDLDEFGQPPADWCPCCGREIDDE